jgi:16S rRNA (uracil1498-N3)-methyltransferase
MQRFYLPAQVEQRTLVLSDPERVHHLKDVLRLRAGDEIEVFNGLGQVSLCQIRSLAKNAVLLEVVSQQTLSRRGPTIAIGCAVPKNVRMDDVVDKLSQLGVSLLAPLKTQRVVLSLENVEAKLARWRRIAQSAAEQSRRPTLLEISDILELEGFFKLSQNYELKLIPTLEGKRSGLKQTLETRKAPASVAVLIGPEGDFTPDEVELALARGFTSVTLGDQVLRVDTAAIAVAGFLQISFSTA